MKRTSVTILIAGFFGGILGSYAWQNFLNFAGHDRADLTSAVSKQEQQSDTSSNVSSATNSDAWSVLASDAEANVVAIQVFNGAQLVRSGSGSIVSSDGLIVTVNDLVPNRTYIYQILSSDKIFRGTVVAQDARSNLALIKVEATNLNITPFSQNQNYQLGTELLLAGRIVDLSRGELFAQRGMIQYLSSGHPIIDTTMKTYLNGAEAVVLDGSVIGLTTIRQNRVSLLTVKNIQDFLAQYLRPQ